MRTELMTSPLAARVLHLPSSNERAPHTGDSVTFTNGAMPIAFASVDRAIEELPEADRPLPMNGLCPANMASIDDRFCIDKYEASLVEMLGGGEERPHPYYKPVEHRRVRAVSEKGVYPQGYIS